MALELARRGESVAVDDVCVPGLCHAVTLAIRGSRLPSRGDDTPPGRR
jgi:hypothetical protein